MAASGDVTEAELAVLRVLWRAGPSRIRGLTGALYPDGSVSHYATVKKLLERLEAKGYVRRDRTEAAHVFEAVVERDHLIGHRLRAVAASLCDGLMTPLLMHLVDPRRLTESELERVRALLEEYDPPPERKQRQ